MKIKAVDKASALRWYWMDEGHVISTDGTWHVMLIPADKEVLIVAGSHTYRRSFKDVKGLFIQLGLVVTKK